MDNNKPKITPEIDTKGAVNNIRVLMQEVKRLKSEMATLEEGSDLWNKLAHQAGEYQHKILAISETVRGASSDFGDLLGNVSKVGSAMIGGFQTAKAAMSLFGIESEEVTKSIQKMQNLMAMTLGLASIDAGIKSFKKLQAAIQANVVAAQALQIALSPKFLLLLAAVVAPLVIVFKNLKKEISEATRAQKEFNAIYSEGLKNSTKQISKVQTLVKIAKDETASLQDREKAIKALNKIVPDYNANIDKTTGKYQESKQALDAYILSLKNKAIAEAAQSKIAEKAQEIVEKQIEIDKQKAIVANAQAGQALYGGDNTNNPGYAATVDAEKAANKKIKELEEEIGKLNNESDDIIKKFSNQLATLFEETDKNVDKTAKRTIEHINWIHKKGKLAISDIAPTVKDINIQFVEGARTAREEWIQTTTEIEKAGNTAFEGLKNSLSLIGETSLGDIAVSQWTNALTDFQMLFSNIMHVIETEGTDTWSSYTQIAAQSFQAIGSMLNALSANQDTSSRKGFETQKKLQIASATMSMLSGIVSAMTNSIRDLGVPAGPIVGAALSSMIAGMGAAQIASISKQKFDSSGTSANLSSVGQAASIIAPVQYSQATTGAQVESALADTRVYVTETDIRNVGNRVSVIEAENRY